MDHSSVLIDEKIYFSGGITDQSTNEFFYLDVSKPFNTSDNNTSMPWFDLTDINSPKTLKGSACSGGENNGLLFVFGGYIYGSDNISSHQYDISKKVWTDIKSGPINRYGISCAKFNDSLIAIFGGAAINGSDNLFNDLWTFDISTSLWNLKNAQNPPSPRVGYCAVTLPDQSILYIGGQTSDLFAPMDTLPLYNTKSDTWINMAVSGPAPPGRRDFSAVLTNDNRIIIYGGMMDELYVSGDAWTLYIENSQWSWTKGNITNSSEDSIIYSYGHTATLVNNYMFINFGNRLPIENNSPIIMLLDVSQKDNFRWVTEFIPNIMNTTV
ncbi:21078_t:CDS:2 [Cetraspora pellucida]|uniref:21078_t:CDS:1 n=1 Tax=Cetraspora pellucida TaxID=1433469 RepID=A0A9N8VD15_9GLOM|nr:21078_t:CDS:2 [Cetraspora pellucida]